MKIRTQKKTRQAGFSLAELMVVIVIIGLLVTLVLPNVIQRLATAQGTVAKADISSLDQALTEYAINNGNRYPDSLDVLVMPDENGHTYLKQRKLPTDPWDNEYAYEPPGPGEPRARVISYGRDGIPGGEGEDRDLDNWDENDG